MESRERVGVPKYGGDAVKFNTPEEARMAIKADPFLTQEWRDMLERVLRDWDEQIARRKIIAD